MSYSNKIILETLTMSSKIMYNMSPITRKYWIPVILDIFG